MSARSWSFHWLVLLSVTGVATAQDAPPKAEEADAPSTPAEFEPLSHFVGAWKGQVSPTENRLKGWIERHVWSWAFEKGEPVGLDVKFEGSKVLDTGRLRYDAPTRSFLFRIEGPGTAPTDFQGRLDPKTETLVLTRIKAGPDGSERLTIRPNSNKLRYTLIFDRKNRGSPSFARVFEASLGKEGVSFAGGGPAPEECIVTGGTATLTVSHDGQTYPLCCTGCREQFEANPERYIAKAKARAEAKAAAPASSAGPDDFDSGKPAKTEKPAEPKAEKPAEPKAEKPAEPESTPPAEQPKAENKAPTWLRLGEALEKQGKKAAAVAYYRKIVNEYPEAEESKTARDRLSALNEKP